MQLTYRSMVVQVSYVVVITKQQRYDDGKAVCGQRRKLNRRKGKQK